MEVLKKALEDYKNKNYEFGMYESDLDIKKAFLDKKIFVLERKLVSRYLVLGREGLFFKKGGYIKWTDITGMRASERYVQYSGTMMSVKIKTIKRKKYNFSSKTFKRKEFLKKGYPKLFYNLFQTYAQSALQSQSNI